MDAGPAVAIPSPESLLDKESVRRKAIATAQEDYKALEAGYKSQCTELLGVLQDLSNHCQV